jgi:type I restriction enzyme, S subunit
VTGPLRLRYVTERVGGTGFPQDEQGRSVGDFPFVKVSDFNLPGNERILYNCSNWISHEDLIRLRAQAVPANSIVFPKIGAALLGNARRVTAQPTVFDNNVLGLVPNGISAEYLYYLLSKIDLGVFANPGPVPSLDESSLLDCHVPVSSPMTQQAIAAFLDVETARIDSLIIRKRHMIELLLARRASVAIDAVSGRIQGEAGLESSSLTWLEERPCHWREVLLRLVARLGSGHTPSREHPEWWSDCIIPWITTGEVHRLRSDRVEYIDSTREMISELGLANSSAELHPADTVVLCRTASAGYSGIMKTSMATSQDFATWTCGPLLRPRFLLLCLRAMRQDLLGRLAMGSTHQTIYMPDIRSICIPLPPVNEQDEIVDAAWSRFGVVDQLVTATERQIGLLQERRQALITVAVTGEMEIPEGVAG